VPGVFRKDKLVRIARVSEHPSHVFIGKNPVVIVVAGDEKIPIADLHPDAQRLLRTVGNQGLMEVPGAVRCFGVVWPLLVHERAGVAYNPVVEIRALPRHGHGRRAAGATSHNRPDAPDLRRDQGRLEGSRLRGTNRPCNASGDSKLTVQERRVLPVRVPSLLPPTSAVPVEVANRL